MPFRITSLALGQSYDCASASEVNLKDIGKSIEWIYKDLQYEQDRAWHLITNACK